MISLLTHAHKPSGANKRDRTHLRECVCRFGHLPGCAPRGSFHDEVRWAAAATGGGGGAYRLHDRITGAATISQRVTGAAQSRRDAETRRAHANGSL